MSTQWIDEIKAIIRHEKGLHARVAAMIVQKASELKRRYRVSLFLRHRDRKPVPATTLLQLVSLAVQPGEAVWVSARPAEDTGETPFPADADAPCAERPGNEPPQAAIAVEELVRFLESDFALSDEQVQRQVDNLLQDSALTAGQVFASMADGLIVTDAHDVVTVFNPAAERIMGMRASDVIGRKAKAVIAGSRMHIVAETGQPELGRRQMIGDAVILTNRTPIVVDGQVKGAVAVFEDISALEKVTHELHEVKELKERLQLVLESVQDGICVVDREGCVTYVNPAYARIVNGRREDLIGRDVRNLSPRGARRQALETGKPVLGHLAQKDGDVTVIADAYPIIVDGEVTGVVSIVKTLTDVQTLAEKLNRMAARAEYLEQELRRAKKPGGAFARFIGQSGKVRDALAMAEKAAEGPATVLIRGESGTGKELVAEGIHESGPRSKGPFIRVNCAAIPETLLESELFGHEKGAFTGAIKRKLGKFELAHKGTLFLDEIGELDKGMQAKLLRVLQEKEISRIGGEETFTVDVKIIAATNQDLERLVAEGRFREDLYYRLNVIPILLPPLRERKEDIPLLVEHFLQQTGREQGKALRGIHSDALEALMHYSWPGNVRELANLIERVVTLSDGPWITDSDLPTYLRERAAEENHEGRPLEERPAGGRYGAGERGYNGREHKIGRSVGGISGSLFRENRWEEQGDAPLLTWEAYEQQIITLALRRHGSFNAAAKALGLTHKTVAAKARKYGIDKNEAGAGPGKKGAALGKSINE
ncbi:sigma-54-dependent transcriptional activator (nifa/ntrc family) [Heliomicrobium modesticaldum Ice1]|uniref:HTH-type transcriptional regulatory protein TyrR n=1 Tax=Heliobacterium modesticaldum (strain ATCC 51547 / Ice1) TaxID=498761 RepID=B0TAR7_HELMI|nr:sigma 54-interacting transcriptional regulator [Heliomicrobium modesticaldum]ABZ83719.1 sigma-54-dependent transcriptional activator (nifa/ntrc family) [Heliomicrobium modesticaldum Ice1]